MSFSLFAAKPYKNFDELFEENRSEVVIGVGGCSSDVYYLLERALKEVETFDRNKVTVLLIEPQDIFVIELAGPEKRFSIWDSRNHEYKNQLFHVTVSYDGSIYDYLSDFKGPIDEYLEKFFSSEVDHDVTAFTFDQYVTPAQMRSEKKMWIKSRLQLIKELKYEPKFVRCALCGF